MGFIYKLFKKILSSLHTKKEKARKPCGSTTKYEKAMAFNQAMRTLLNKDAFLARKDYHYLFKQYKDILVFFENLKESGMLNNYIKTKDLDKSEIEFFIQHARGIANAKTCAPFIEEHNKTFISRHMVQEQEYLDNILKECDANIMLDKEQREVVLSNEDFTLVIAGAGAGKTTTIAAKVKYLVERQQILPKQILVISFTNKAVIELQERINHNLHIDCPISTFHKVGFAILKKDSETNKKVVDNGFLYNVLVNYLKSTVLKDSEMVKKLILFFGSYFSAPYDNENIANYFRFIANADFSTLKSNLHEYAKQIIDSRTRKVITLNNEILRSQEEVDIANFLYLNQIEYEYEPVYQYKILDSNKPYTPDFIIKQNGRHSYIEHFGITEDGINNRYNQEDLDKYKQRIKDKILLHRQHKTDLIYTFSRYKDDKTYLQHLQEELERREYKLEHRPETEVYKKLIETEETQYIVRLAILLCTFISNFKTQGYPYEKFDEFKSKSNNERTKLFLDICKTCYLEYQKCLEQGNCIDFQDMINSSSQLIEDKRINKELLDFKYIIVDEYQDISRQRYKLIKNLSDLCNAKIVAVGDDWQSIYAFSGSILPLFTHFCDEFGYGKELRITRTYRNAQELINIAGNFVQRNTSQISKRLISNKHIENPVIILTYSESHSKLPKEKNGGKYQYLAEAVNQAIEDVLAYNAQEKKNGVAHILLIGRYGFDARNLCKAKDFNYKDKTNDIYSVKFGCKIKLSFLTAHSSKGLSADNVIIINAKDDTYGFPSKVCDDPILRLVVSNDDSYTYAEERRLFYVALTRTKNHVYIVMPENHPSDFIKELLSDTTRYPNVQLKGKLKTEINNPRYITNKCPICGYPMQLRMNKNYGLRLWICTNDQEVCGFMTNDKRGGDLSIKKCDFCKDGYLVVKRSPSKGEFFLACTNYKRDRSGCNRIINKAQYQYWNNNTFGTADPSANKPAYTQQNQNQSASESQPPEMLPIKPAKERAEHSNTINQTTTIPYTIGGIEYHLIADSEQKLLTDINLLQKIQKLRTIISKEYNTSENKVIPLNSLIELSTRQPMTLEELSRIEGIGKKRIEAFGYRIIEIVKKHCNTAQNDITDIHHS